MQRLEEVQHCLAHPQLKEQEQTSVQEAPSVSSQPAEAMATATETEESSAQAADLENFQEDLEELAELEQVNQDSAALATIAEEAPSIASAPAPLLAADATAPAASPPRMATSLCHLVAERRGRVANAISIRRHRPRTSGAS